MYNNHINILNVYPSRVHIGLGSACTHEVGTYSNKYMIYAKGYHQFIKDSPFNYRFKDKFFTLKDGIFKHDKLSFKLPTRKSISPIERVILSLGFPLNSIDGNSNIDIQQTSFKDILSTLTSLSLKDLGLVPKNMNLDKRLKYGNVVYNLYVHVSSGSARVKSTNPYLRFLNEQDTLQLKSKLFNLSDTKSYQVSLYSMKYQPTDTMKKVFDNSIELLKSIDFVNNNIKLKDLDFSINVDELHDIRTRDVILILNDCIGFNDTFIIRPKLLDTQNSRVYSVFTSMSSETRKLLGYINYDIGSALQTICLQLVENPELYPLHQELVSDKNTFREKVANETGNNIAWVKQELSKIDNLDKEPKRYSNYPTLQAYLKESFPMRKEIIADAEPEILEIAECYAKPKWEKKWDTTKKDYEFINIGVKEASLFFFIWTQWERQIRHVMMECFSSPQACHQVHDAVYSKENINSSIIEKKVLDETGFKVKISKD